ncbi:MAG: hypothetical protein AAF564_16030 [Bacteroidota bacterium]
MTDLPPEYVAELYRQIAFLSAVIGGFAIAFMGTLLTLTSQDKTVSRTIWLSALAATSLIVSTFASVVVLLDVIRLGITSFDLSAWPEETLRSKSIAGLASFMGMYVLLIAIGFSGRIRDKKTGIVTAVIAFVGLILLTIVLSGTV